MAMTKKERERMEQALTDAALRTTADVKPDVPIPSGYTLSKGWLPRLSTYGRNFAVPACSDSVHHAYGQQDKTTSQGPRALYSTRLLALRAARREVEREAAKRLRDVDLEIEAELNSGESK